jgi:hypothetical protein
MAINRALYQEFMHLYINQAIKESDGTPRGIYERLAEMQVRGLLVRHKEEKRRALKDARLAFDEHRHWPLEIILSHLNIERQDS